MFFFSHYGSWMAAIFLLAMTGFCYMLARSFASPILEMRAASRRFSTGELDVRVSPPVSLRGDELGDLARDFNEMAERLGVMIERQKRLLHEISHELRSPLARIQVAIELLRSADGTNNGDMIDRIEQESDRLEDMIGQILQLTRLEDKAWNIEPVPVDLVQLIGRIIADARFEAGSEFERFRWNGGQDIGMTSVPVFATEELLGRALENVIRNGLKFSPPERSIDVTLSLTDGQAGRMARIDVADHGPGVAADQLAQIFEPFHRCQEDRCRITGGFGLGLAITKRSIERFGGKVSASTHPEGGLVVTMTLPLAPM